VTEDVSPSLDRGRSFIVPERLEIRVLAVLLAAVVFAAVDQWVKLFVTTPDWAYHHRSDTWFLGSCVLFIGMTGLAMLPSIGVTIGAALFAGGLLGNMMSASADHFEVPNPLLIGHTDGIAFNVADVFILTGNITLMVACGALAIRNRERLEGWRASARLKIRERS
jgi:lipoprotein signal peptidase